MFLSSLGFLSRTQDYTQVLDELGSQKAQLVDIREKSEWDQSRFKGAVHIPLSDIKDGKALGLLGRYPKCYLHCRSGNRVRIAEGILRQQGYQNFEVITDSMGVLSRSGFDLLGN